MKKKCLAWLLLAVMVFSLFPMAVFAEETEEHDHDYIEQVVEVSEPVTEEAEATPESVDEAVAAVQAVIDTLPSVDSVTAGDYDAVQDAYDAYESLAAEQQALITGAEIFEALFNWFNAQVVPLETANGSNIESKFKAGYQSIELTENITNKALQYNQGGASTVGLDLGGYTVSDSTIGFMPLQSSSLAIQDGTISNSTVRLYSGNNSISNVSLDRVVLMVCGGTLSLSNVTQTNRHILTQGNGSITINSGSYNRIVGTATINGGTFTSGSDDGKVEITGSINGGTFSSSVTTNSSSRISNGTFNSTVTATYTTISGGTFNGLTYLNGATVTGGTFTGETWVSPTASLRGGTFAKLKSEPESNLPIYHSIASGYILVDASTNKPVAIDRTEYTNVKVVAAGFNLAITVPEKPIAGVHTTMSATVSGTSGTVSYQWYRGTESTALSPISGATNRTYTENVSDAGVYYYMVTATSNDKTITAKKTVQFYDSKLSISGAISTYIGDPLPLIRDASNDYGGTFYYSLKENEGFTTTVPTAVNAGTYTVYYYVKTDNYQTPTRSVEATIEPRVTTTRVTVENIYTKYAGCTEEKAKIYKLGGSELYQPEEDETMTWYFTGTENKGTGGTANGLLQTKLTK